MVTMTTVGYGNITPQTIPEKIVMICVMCFTSGFMGYMVGGIKSALSKSVKEKKYLNDIKQKFRRYMKTHKTPHKLRIKIIGYLDYLYTYQKKNILKENEILRELSLPLQRDIYTFTRGHLLSKSAAFLGFSSTFLNYLGEKLEIEIFSPRDLIFKQGQKSTNMYFVRHGRVEIFHQATTTVFSEITHNQYFGEIGFFLGCKRLASARSVDFCELFSLDREDFNSILRKMPRDEELTRIIKAQCKASDLSYLGVRCYFCDGSGHVVSACNNYVWKVNNKDIILNSKYMKNKTGQKIVLDEYDVNLRRFDIKHLTRYSLNNVSLDETSGYEIYNNRDSLAAKAKEFDHRRITKERAQNTVRFLLDEEMDEENTDLNVLPEDMKFGKIYVNRRKTLLDQSSLSNSRDGLMKDLEIDSLKTFEISA